MITSFGGFVKKWVLIQQEWGRAGDSKFLFFLSFFLKRFCLFILRLKGREGEREGEKHQHVAASHSPPTRDLARKPGMCPDWESNQPPLGLQASAQSTEPHQPGPKGTDLDH